VSLLVSFLKNKAAAKSAWDPLPFHNARLIISSDEHASWHVSTNVQHLIITRESRINV
jgi:hypothetical protein